VEADIAIYFNKRLLDIPHLRLEYSGSWPPLEAKIIVKRAGKLIYVSTIYEYISHYKGNPYERLKKIASFDSPISTAIGSLDRIYSFILTEAFSSIDNDEMSCIQSCLSLLVSA